MLTASYCVGKYFADKKGEKLKKYFKYNSLQLREHAKQLVLRTFGSIENYKTNQCGAILPDVVKLTQKLVGSYQIVVYNDKNLHRNPIYATHKNVKCVNIDSLANESNEYLRFNVKNVIDFLKMTFVSTNTTRFKYKMYHL